MHRRQFYAGWGDVDVNAHMRNAAYLEKSTDVRLMYFIENGFPVKEFVRLHIGPVVMKDELEYFKEVGLHQEITVTFELAGHALDGSRYLVRNEFFRADGTLSTRVTSAGGWLNLLERKLIAPPPGLLSAMNALGRTSDFVVLASSIDRRS